MVTTWAETSSVRRCAGCGGFLFGCFFLVVVVVVVLFFFQCGSFQFSIIQWLVACIVAFACEPANEFLCTTFDDESLKRPDLSANKRARIMAKHRELFSGSPQKVSLQMMFFSIRLILSSNGENHDE